jgi:hypothetical protein
MGKVRPATAGAVIFPAPFRRESPSPFAIALTTAMDHPNPLSPHPDFNLLGQYMISAGEEIRKAQNLPTIVAGDQILAELGQIRQELQLSRREFRQEQQQLRQDFAMMVNARYALPLHFSYPYTNSIAITTMLRGFRIPILRTEGSLLCHSSTP